MHHGASLVGQGIICDYSHLIRDAQGRRTPVTCLVDAIITRDLWVLLWRASDSLHDVSDAAGSVWPLSMFWLADRPIRSLWMRGRSGQLWTYEPRLPQLGDQNANGHRWAPLHTQLLVWESLDWDGDGGPVEEARRQNQLKGSDKSANKLLNCNWRPHSACATAELMASPNPPDPSLIETNSVIDLFVQFLFRSLQEQHKAL